MEQIFDCRLLCLQDLSNYLHSVGRSESSGSSDPEVQSMLAAVGVLACRADENGAAEQDRRQWRELQKIKGVSKMTIYGGSCALSREPLL